MGNASGCLPILINIVKINHEERCGKIKHENYLAFWQTIHTNDVPLAYQPKLFVIISKLLVSLSTISYFYYIKTN
jgi:hypothetical protein